jgi:hypothetical protein
MNVSGQKTVIDTSHGIITTSTYDKDGKRVGFSQQSHSNLHSSNAPDSGVVSKNIDQAPEFPGGYLALRDYFSNKLDQTKLKEARSQKNCYKVWLRFIIDSDGSVIKTDFIDNSICFRPYINDILRVARFMPKWLPAKSKSKNVRCSINVPIPIN